LRIQVDVGDYGHITIEYIDRKYRVALANEDTREEFALYLTKIEFDEVRKALDIINCQHPLTKSEPYHDGVQEGKF
jgi:hypothetical protein